MISSYPFLFLNQLSTINKYCQYKICNSKKIHYHRHMIMKINGEIPRSNPCPQCNCWRSIHDEDTPWLEINVDGPNSHEVKEIIKCVRAPHTFGGLQNRLNEAMWKYNIRFQISIEWSQYAIHLQPQLGLCRRMRTAIDDAINTSSGMRHKNNIPATQQDFGWFGWRPSDDTPDD
jgi:hypothetical protein